MMTTMKAIFCTGAAALALAATPALAQGNATAPASATAAGVSAGATVYDTEGGVVGTIDAVNGNVAVVATGTNKVGIPLTAFGPGDKGPRLAMTREQLDQAAQGAKAEQKAAVVQGATVVDSAGVEIGHVTSVDAQYAVVDMGNTPVKLPLTAFAKRDSGLMVGMTKAQIEAAAHAAAPAPAAEPAEAQ
jgi:preprotein translocase subunit YajC